MKRKRIWEISSDYHCSIIGTCLDLEEVVDAFKRAGIEVSSDYTDYVVHSMAVHSVGELSRFSNKVTEKLNAKYCSEVFKSSGCKTQVSLKEFWRRSCSDGAIAGAYWALMSHPNCPDELIQQAFGEVHMLSHLAGHSERTCRETMRRHAGQISELKNLVERYKQDFAKVQEELNAMRMENSRLKKAERNLGERCRQLQDDLSGINSHSISENVRYVNSLHRKLKITREQHEMLRTRYSSMVNELDALKESNEFLKCLLESSLTKSCESCGERCKRIGLVDLNNRKILLVGGRISVIPQYRSLVEIMNGICIHHDGGRDQSRLILQKMVPGAEIIVCFLDCVSHDAVRCVKKTCKNSNQKLIMLKNSGIATFRRELEKAV